MVQRLQFILTLLALIQSSLCDASWSRIQEQWALPPSSGKTQASAAWLDVYRQEPPLSPDYMVDNTGNNHGVAPIKGTYNGPVWARSGNFSNYMRQLRERKASGMLSNSTTTSSNSQNSKRESGYWLPQLAGLGKAPYTGDGYVFYRNVLDYGADNSGESDTVEAINAAVQDGDRCGEECGNTFVQGAVVYFPPGTYKICTPIVQLYYTQFISDPLDRAVIKGCDDFTGIALMDVDPYVPNQAQPDGTGVNWYINQNQFFRQIRNFVFDLTEMPSATDDRGQKLVPTGLHWQVSQATSLQNLLFKMPTASAAGDNLTHVGIFTENGSGGFVSNLEFEGGAIGWRVGSQQYTAIGLKFTNCVTAVQMIWDWGFNWQRIEINGGTIGFNISGKGGIDKQGIGSVSIIDSTIKDTPIGILTGANVTAAPNIVIDNTEFTNVGAIVQDTDGDVLLAGGSEKVDLWAAGLRYKAGTGSRETGAVKGRPSMSSKMLDGGKLFTRSRPQYENLGPDSFLVATEHGCSNDATGDNADAINSFLQKAASSGMIAYFPAGIYAIKSTVTIPAGSKVQGTSWSQIQATGDYFDDMENPRVAVRVGEPGDVGTMEIVEMLFTVNGPTAGAIMVEWNIKASSPGAAALWDSHIRVGGGIGTKLDQATCPKMSFNRACIAASMLMHVTPDASGYFENFWAWTADHDNDYSLYWEVDSTISQISLFSARGVLIESQDPVWIYGSGSEHTVMYQYETYKAKNVYLGHIQTESPYYQPEPVAPVPFNSSIVQFNGDPDFSDCEDKGCKEAWGLRIIDSEDITIHSAGLYSWFDNYGQTCLKSESCQSRIMEVRGSSSVAIYNIFTKGVVEVATAGDYNISSKDVQQGYTTEVSVWFPADSDPEDDYPVVYLDPTVYSGVPAQCTPPCQLVFPPSSLDEPTTISIPKYTTSLEVKPGTITSITVTVSEITVTTMSYSNVIISSGQSSETTITPYLSVDLPSVVTTIDDQTRTLHLPPWPLITRGPPDQWTSTQSGNSSSTDAGWTFPTAPPNPPHVTLPSITKPDYTGPEPDPNQPTRWPTDLDPTPVPTPVPEEGEDDDDDDDDNHYKTSCKLWFFFICISWPGPFDVHIEGWEWNFPPGKWGPGPPPPINWPPGITLKGTLPPWPEITVHPGGSLEASAKPTDCEPAEAQVCMTKSVFATTVSQGTTKTTSTSVTETCATVMGCNLQDIDTTTSQDACTIRRRNIQATAPAAQPTRNTEGTERRNIEESGPRLLPRADIDWSCESPGDLGIIWPENPLNNDGQNDIRKALLRRRNAIGADYLEIRANDLQFTAYYVVYNMGPLALEYFNSREMPHVYLAYLPSNPQRPSHIPQRRDSDVEEDANLQGFNTRDLNLTRRDIHIETTNLWYLSQASWPPGYDFDVPQGAEHDPENDKYATSWDDSFGQGQTIYITERQMESNTEYSDRFRRLPMVVYGTPTAPAQSDINHGVQVAALAAGKTRGIARKAEVVFAQIQADDPPMEKSLEALIKIAEDTATKAINTCVVNMSWGYDQTAGVSKVYFQIMTLLMQRMAEKYGCIFVAAPGNTLRPANSYPALAWDKVPGMMVAGAVDAYGAPYDSMEGKDIFNIWAAGVNIPDIGTGTSFASPLVAGLAAYFRGLPNYLGGRDPVSIRETIQTLARRLQLKNNAQWETRIIWNGLIGTQFCGPSVNGIQGRQFDDAGSCPLPGGGGGGNNDPHGPPVDFQSGEPGPLCTTNCGKLCEGYYCDPTPTGKPPDFTSPTRTPTVTSKSTVTETSSPPTTTKPPTTTPSPTTSVTPLTRGPINCFDEADFPGHADVNPDDQDELSYIFSTIYTDVPTIGPGDDPVTLHGTDKHGINYDFSAEWVHGCVTTVDRQSFGFPIGDFSLVTAYLLVREDYTKCNNGGVGGSCQAGCLLYTFKGALGDQRIAGNFPDGLQGFTDGPQGRRNFTIDGDRSRNMTNSRSNLLLV